MSAADPHEAGGIEGPLDDLFDRGAARADESVPITSTGARTPEELETLFEDTLLLCDHQILTSLFESGATLVMGDEQPVRGGEAIARAVLARRTGISAYVADPRRVLLARNIAIVVTDQGVNVMHRGEDGVWRYAIVLHAMEESNGRKEDHDPGDDSRPGATAGGRRQGRGGGALVVQQSCRDQGNRRRHRRPDDDR